jgi:hypothetical protein
MDALGMRDGEDCSGETTPDRVRARESMSVRVVPDDDLVQIAVRAALGATVDARAWALVQLAAALRRRGDVEGALHVLDLAWGLRPSPRVEAAVYTCAVAAHCDADRFEVARTVGEQTLRRWCDSALLRALGRAYIGLYLDRGDPADIERAQRLFDEADPAEPDSTALTAYGL